MGKNIGVEINGKYDQFTRPVLVLKKCDKYFFLGLPLTTKEKFGSWYLPITFGNRIQRVILSQARAYDYKRFKEKMGQLDIQQLGTIAEAYIALNIGIKK